MSKEAKNKALIPGLAILIALLLGLQLTGPFNDDLRGACGAFFALMARNHCNLGLDVTGGIPVMNLTNSAPDDIVYYRHHPPGIILLVALAFRVFGESESSARLVPLIAFTILLVAIGRLGQRLIGERYGPLALLITAAIPMGAYYAVFVNFEIPTLAAWAVCLAALVAWRQTGRRAAMVTSLAAWLLGGLLDWPLYLGTPFVVFLAWRTDRPARKRLAVALALIPLLVATTVTAWQMVQQARWGRFPESHGLAAYLAEISPLSRRVDLGAWFLFQTRTLTTLGSLAFPCALLGTISSWRRRRPAAPLLGLLLGVGFLNLFLGAGRSNTHDYWSLYLLPWLALGSAELVQWIASWRWRRALLAAAIAAVAILAVGGAQSILEIRSRSRYQYADRGKSLARVMRAGEVGVTWPWDFQVPYYAGAAVLAAPHPPRSLASLLSQQRVLGLADGHLVLIVLPGEKPEVVAGELAPRLPALPCELRQGTRVFTLSP